MVEAVGLNIKSEAAHELAKRLARLTGENMTQAVTQAIRERLERESARRDRDRLAEELVEIGRRCAAHERHDRRAHGDFLYDGRGLPR